MVFALGNRLCFYGMCRVSVGSQCLEGLGHLQCRARRKGVVPTAACAFCLMLQPFPPHSIVHMVKEVKEVKEYLQGKSHLDGVH